MLFGVKLQNEMYPAWREHYMAYDSLKKLLREATIDVNSKGKKHAHGGEGFTDRDEGAFVSALDGELEKVYSFQTQQYEAINRRLEQLEGQIEGVGGASANSTSLDWNAFQVELDNLLSEARELDHFARLNYTGFQKIVKKHDRLHPNYNSVKALLSIRLKELPFHSEDYSPLLLRISNLYSFLRENVMSSSIISTNSQNNSASLKNSTDSLEFQSFKFWIHNDNLMEVKTKILRHLPVLVYSNDSSNSNNNDTFDPTITSLYFDNDSFEIYNLKLMKSNASPTLRLRWSGKLYDHPDIFMEKKIVDKSSTDESLHEVRLKVKEKYLKDFIINGDVEQFKKKTLAKFKEMGSSKQTLDGLEHDIDDLHEFITKFDLQPALRSVYKRTAFQIPGDDRVRITIDSDILFIREDSFDEDRPIRNPNNWHRSDIDQNVENPLSLLRKNEFSKFPHSVMEIKIKNNTGKKQSELNGISIPFSRKHGKWIEELTTSHLVKEVPNFSKFIQGIASLFLEDDRLDILPFWLPELEDDIRESSNDKSLKNSNENIKSKLRRLTSNNISNELPQIQQDENDGDDLDVEDSDDDDVQASSGAHNKTLNKNNQSGSTNLARTSKRNAFSLFPGDSKLTIDSEDEEIVLPSGVQKPKTWLKQSGPIKVETKVWLANERTFNRWLSVTSLFSALTFTIYSSVKKSEYEQLATFLAYLYFGLTLFTGVWGYFIYNKRLNFIKLRDGKHLDAPLGPLVVSFAMLLAVIINFVVSFKHAASQINALDLTQQQQQLQDVHPIIQAVNNFIFKLVA